MPNRFGFEGQMGWSGSDEAVFGTAATINRFLEAANYEVELGDQIIVSPGIHGARVQLATSTKQGRRVVNYRAAFDYYYEGAGQWFRHALGSSSSTNITGSVWHHTFSRKDVLPVGLTTEFEVPPDFIKLTGSRVNELVWECGNENAARVTAAGPAKDYTLAASGAAYSPPASNILGVFHEGSITVDGIAKQWRNVRIRVSNDIQADDFRSGSRTIYAAEARAHTVEGNVVFVADEAALLTKLRDFVVVNMNVKLTGPTISGVHSYEWEAIMSDCTFNPATRSISGPNDEALVELDFMARKATAEPVIIRMKNTQSAASL